MSRHVLVTIISTLHLTMYFTHFYFVTLFELFMKLQHSKLRFFVVTVYVSSILGHSHCRDEAKDVRHCLRHRNMLPAARTIRRVLGRIA